MTIHYGRVEAFPDRRTGPPNRRAYRRFRADFSAEVLASGGIRLDPRVTARVHDISAGGLALITDRAFAKGTWLGVAIAIPGQVRPVEVEVTVMSSARWLGADFVAHCKFVDAPSAIVQLLETSLQFTHAHPGRRLSDTEGPA